MNAMEPTSAALLKAIAVKGGEAGVDATKEAAQGLLQKLLGPYLTAVGENWSIRPKERMYNNLIEVAVRAKRKIDAAGIDPNQVPLKIIHPLLEAAVLEETPSIQDIWAAMLTNAADPRQGNPVSPSFPAILKELTSREVQFLDALHTDSHNKAAAKNKTFTTFFASYKESELFDIYCAAGLSSHLLIDQIPASESQEDREGDRRSFEFTIAICRRHNLIEESAWPRVVDNYDAVKNPQPTIEIELDVSYLFTEIGRCFVAACRPPTPPSQCSVPSIPNTDIRS